MNNYSFLNMYILRVKMLLWNWNSLNVILIQGKQKHTETHSHYSVEWEVFVRPIGIKTWVSSVLQYCESLRG